MEISNLIPHIEALVFASDKPLSSLEITELLNQAFGFMDDKLPAEQIDAALEGIIEKYNAEFYPFEVKQSGGGWQFLTKKEFHKTVAQLNGEKFLKRLSAAALETLAIIAYKQPVTKGEIESIRGVSSDYAVQKLLEKELISITGRNEKLPGHPLVYATSKNFMDYFGINSPEDLPKIREVLAEQIIQPTIVSDLDFQSEKLRVADDGALVEEVNEEVEVEVNDGAYINGHALEAMDTDDETITEDLSTEEALEEFIADETFIESDDAAASEEIKEAHINYEENSSDSGDEISNEKNNQTEDDNSPQDKPKEG